MLASEGYNKDKSTENYLADYNQSLSEKNSRDRYIELLDLKPLMSVFQNSLAFAFSSKRNQG